MSIKSIPLLLASLSIAFVPFYSIAAVAPIETVYVSATRSETTQLPVATQITVITADEIRLSGATLLSDVLRSQASIQLSDSDGSGGRNVTASMRGLSGANNVLVLVDGRKLNNPSMAAPALNTVSLNDVERIEIVQGSAGVLYGDQAIGGVINIITRRAATGEVAGSLSALGGSDNLEDYTVSFTQGFENGLSLSLSAHKRNADNFRDHNQSASSNHLGNIRYDFSHGFIFGELQDIEDELNLAGYLLDSEAAIDPRKAQTLANYSNQKTDLARIGGGVDLSEYWKLLGEYADRDEDTESYYGYGAPTLGNMRVKNITPRVVGNLPTAKGNSVIVFGYDQVNSEYSVPDWGTDIEQTINAYYGQVIYPLSEHLNVNAGVRHSSVKNTNHAMDTKNNDDVNATELGVNYAIDNGWHIFGRYADGFRFSNADENGLVLPSVQFLKAQTAYSSELGTEWQGKAASAKWSLYRLDLDNEIVYDALIENSNSWSGFGANVNLDSSRRQGVAIDARVVLSRQLSLQVNYTYTDAELTSGSFSGNAVPNVAKNRANASIIFLPVKSLTFYFDADYTGDRYRSNDDLNSGEKVSAIVLFNLNATWQYKAFEVNGRIKNITDEHYAGLYGISPNVGYYQYPQPGRHYEAGITYRF